MNKSAGKSFHAFFETGSYLTLKNHLYNYLLRKKAVEGISRQREGMILDLGSGISPMETRHENVVYSDLSFSALKELRQIHSKGWHVVADATALPFKTKTFKQVICTELIEHIKDDSAALREVARVMKGRGTFILTFPHRKFYFANDDRLVCHFRRYEFQEMEALLKEAGFRTVSCNKILGPLDKVAMSCAAYCFSFFQGIDLGIRKRILPPSVMRLFELLFKWANRLFLCLAWLDARISPFFLATQLLIEAELVEDNTPTAKAPLDNSSGIGPCKP